MEGILTPLVTPLRATGELDTAGLNRLIDHVLAGGVHGLFLLGTTGEGPALGAKLREEALRASASAIAKRVPFVVGTTSPSLAESLELAEASAKAGAVATVYAGPLYAPVSQAALAAHVGRFADQCPLPVYLYNMPSHTHLFFSVEIVVELAKHPNIIGLKDSSADLMYFQRLCRALPAEFPLYMGPEELLLPALLAGAAGGVNGGSNLFPHLYSGLYNAFCAGNLEEARRLQGVILRVSETVYTRGYLAGLKTALNHCGICDAALAEPLPALDPAAASAVRAGLDNGTWA